MPGRTAEIDRNKCVGCGACIENCPAKAIIMLPGWTSQVQKEKCIGCGRAIVISKDIDQVLSDLA